MEQKIVNLQEVVKTVEKLAALLKEVEDEQDDQSVKSPALSILIQYERKTLAMNVFINGELQPNIKTIRIEATDMRPPLEYQCDMYGPVPDL